MSAALLTLRWLEGRYTVCRLTADDPIPHWAASARGFVSITRTLDELSIVAPDAEAPTSLRAQRGLALLRVEGVLDFSEVGILARLTRALATAEISVFAVSTYDTDYLLVREAQREAAQDALCHLDGVTFAL